MPVLGKESDGKRHWFIEWAAHHWYAYWVVAYFLSLATNLIPPENIVATIGGVVIFFIWIGIYQRVMYIHRFGLCLKCIELAPLDPEIQIKKHDRMLRFTHRLHDVKTTLAWGMLGWLTWMALTSNFFNLFLTPRSTITLIFLLPIEWFPLLFMERAVRIHNWLHPWCPYCRWDDGGEHEEVPDPVPSGEIDDRDHVTT